MHRNRGLLLAAIVVGLTAMILAWRHDELTATAVPTTDRASELVSMEKTIETAARDVLPSMTRTDFRPTVELFGVFLSDRGRPLVDAPIFLVARTGVWRPDRSSP